MAFCGPSFYYENGHFAPIIVSEYGDINIYHISWIYSKITNISNTFIISTNISLTFLTSSISDLKMKKKKLRTNSPPVGKERMQEEEAGRAGMTRRTTTARGGDTRWR